ncbi:MAG: aminotransferase class I/II-fold pyridoxal phosphate-dependent enzyme [Fimbriimonadaceae bacterium]|nr:MAG: cystathionine gamma-lyase [Armatimonadetes bacterium OLB18]WKZ80225.1 MAG: aminotransferase class I/II-fold pyridoxal phosphate-dependent enzyme [Fimbriimonadaceae bacterium]
MSKSSYRDRSVLIHGKFKSEKWDFHDHILPPIPTSVAFRLRSAERGAEGFRQFANPELDRSKLHPIYIYSRLDEPGQGLLEETLAFAEKGETAVSFATGMAAISAVIGIHVKAGDHIVAHKTLYGCTYSLITGWLERFGVSHTFVDFRDPQAIAKAIRPETKVVYFESPCNPNLDLIDIEEVVSAAGDANKNRDAESRLFTIIDNTFATPYCQRPLPLGVDYVVHSLTKNLAGFGADMGGAVIGPRERETDLLLFRKDFGGSLSPKAAWDILTFGIPTLALRVERQQQNAQRVAEYLDLNPKVKLVRYPGLDGFPQRELARKQMRDIDDNFAPGSMIYFELSGSPEEAYQRAKALIDHLAVNSLSITLAVSLGQIRTLIEHPASMTHSAVPPEAQQEAGIAPGGIRMSLGIEDARDILSDLESALEAVK